MTPKSRDLLVVKDSRGGVNNPADSVVTAFYQYIFKDLVYDYSDASVEDSLTLAILGKYQKIVWLSNTYSDQPNSSFVRNREDIISYAKNGGQFFLASFQPSFLIAQNVKFNQVFTPDEEIFNTFKIQQVERKPAAALNGAYPVASDYDSLWIDPLKSMAQFPGHVLNVECIFPTPDATLIYRFNSAYDTATTQGKMKNKPIGIEYLGDDFKVIVLSVPVYYLDTLDAKTLLEFVVNEKFKSSTGIGDTPRRRSLVTRLTSQPNPCREETTVNYRLSAETPVTLDLYTQTGTRVLHWEEGRKGPGSHRVVLPLPGFSKGFYLLVLQAGNEIYMAKLIVQ
ncbi:MAG: T9SS type A sorting domain-containing protein [bacterium]